MVLVPLHQYRATVIRFIDGDTVRLRVDLGFHLTFEDSFRLLGINTPERGQPGAAAAAAMCNQLAPPGAQVMIDTRAPADKYGRFLATVRTADGIVVNTELLERGLARPYNP